MLGLVVPGLYNYYGFDDSDVSDEAFFERYIFLVHDELKNDLNQNQAHLKISLHVVKLLFQKSSRTWS